MMTKEVNAIIVDFIKNFDSVKEFFLCGGCYYFTTILKERFDYLKSGEVLYDPIDGHFLIKFCRSDLYDVRGNVTELYKNNDKLIKWSTYHIEDPKHYRRIFKDCVLMERGKD